MIRKAFPACRSEARREDYAILSAGLRSGAVTDAAQLKSRKPSQSLGAAEALRSTDTLTHTHTHAARCRQRFSGG